MKLFTLTLAVFLVFSSSLIAETRYVTDEMKITMRSSAGKGKKIVSMLSSGQALTLLGSTKRAYTHVRTAGGKEGYVLSRFLMDEPSSRNQVIALEKQIKKLALEPQELLVELEKTQKTLDELSQQHQIVLKEKTDIAIAFNSLKRTATDAVRITQEQGKLKASLTKNIRELETLKQENIELKNGNNLHWFLVGSGVLFGGLILGLILPNLNIGRRKTRYDTF